MITVTDLSKSYGQQVLFEDVSLALLPNRRNGLVGANGSGKSTFLRILSGQEEASSGSVSIPKRMAVGVLRQDQFHADHLPVIDACMMGNRAVYDAIVEKEALLATPGDFDHDRFGELEDVIAHGDGYSLEARAGEILEGLGIPTESHRRPLGTLSGGFKLRVLLGQVLAGKPDVLMLDEPTNHLDILAIRWLEKFLSAYQGMALVISHDHRFLDNVCTDILDVDYGTIIPYPGNYSDFSAAKEALRDRKEAEISKQEKKIEDMRAFVERFRAKATKARQAQSKLKFIDRIEIDRLPPSSRRYPTFRFRQRRPSGRDALVAKGISKSFGEKQVLKDVSLTVTRKERVAIIGPNGVGKSTLLKILVGELSQDAGTVTWGYEAHPGYFAQDQKEVLAQRTQNVQDFLWDACAGEPIGFVRGQLGLVLFSGEEVEKKLSSLSGGEAARLTFARLAVDKPNVLVLDEPTNHLDLEAIEALVEGLESYQGTLVFVSHDRWFVSRLATRIVEITPEGFRDFPGTYEEYVARCGDDHLDAEVVAAHARKKAREAKAGGAGAAAPTQGAGERVARDVPDATPPARAPHDKQGKKREKEARDRHAKVTAELSAAEARAKEVDAVFGKPGVFGSTPRDQLTALMEERRSLTTRIEKLMAEWERLEGELERSKG